MLKCLLNMYKALGLIFSTRKKWGRGLQRLHSKARSYKMSNDRKKEWKGAVHEVDEEQCTGKGDGVLLHHTLLKV